MTCSVPGCESTTKLMSFPKKHELFLRWLQLLGLPEDSRTSSLKVCALHFSPGCFINYTQVQMGFLLTHDALPNPPGGRPPVTVVNKVATSVVSAENMPEANLPNLLMLAYILIDRVLMLSSFIVYRHL